jgi:hypothetical protein
MRRLPKTFVRPSMVDLAWVAGLVEGEGCFLPICRNGNEASLRVQVRMTDLDVLERLMSIVNIGNVTGPEYNGRNTPVYTWQCGRTADSLALMWALYPYMGERRRKKIWECWIFLRTQRRKQEIAYRSRWDRLPPAYQADAA